MASVLTIGNPVTPKSEGSRVLDKKFYPKKLPQQQFTNEELPQHHYQSTDKKILPQRITPTTVY